ncbi:MAG: type II toxin-antitoxin system RelB family antitoxin [Devosia sp.]
MKTVSVRLDDDVKARWERLAQAHGLNQSRLMREAIIDKLEELEDFYVVSRRVATPFVPVSNDEVWSNLGLNDRAAED